MEGAKVLRFEKGSQAPSAKGEGSVYIIPQDDLPEGISSGERLKLIIEGLVNLDEQGAIINVERIYIDRGQRKYTDPVQDSIEEGLADEQSKD